MKKEDLEDNIFYKCRVFLIDNYYGCLLLLSFHWVTIIPSFIMTSVTIILLIGALSDGV